MKHFCLQAQRPCPSRAFVKSQPTSHLRTGPVKTAKRTTHLNVVAGFGENLGKILGITPRVTYSTGADQINVQELSDLLGYGDDLESRKRLEGALKAETGIFVSAFVQDNKRIGSKQSVSSRESVLERSNGSIWPNRKEHQTQGPGGSSTTGMRLVGWAHGTTDYNLVATVHNVSIAKDMSEDLIGQELIKKITDIIMENEVYDIGLVTPADRESFYQRYDFGPDPEKSITMILPSDEVALRQQSLEKKEIDTSAAASLMRMDTLERMLEEHLLQSRAPQNNQRKG